MYLGSIHKLHTHASEEYTVTVIKLHVISSEGKLCMHPVLDINMLGSHSIQRPEVIR